MEQSFVVIMLAGALQPCPLQQQLPIPLLCLPIGRRGSLLDAWLATIGRSGKCRRVEIVVSTEDDVRALRGMAAANRVRYGSHPPTITVTVERASWRGSAGLLRDVAGSIGDNEIVVAVEAHCLPPPSLEPLLHALNGEVKAVVGAGADDEPAGVYAFRHAALNSVRPIGYVDLKEQLLPALYSQGTPVRLVRIAEHVIRLRDQIGYLDAVSASLNGMGQATMVSRRSSEAMIARSARIVSGSIVERGAVIEDQAIIHGSIVLNGAVVESGAIVSRSIVGPRAVVPARARLIASYQRGNDSVRLKAVAI